MRLRSTVSTAERNINPRQQGLGESRYLSVYHSSVCPFISPPVHLFIYIYLSIYPLTYPSLCLSSSSRYYHFFFGGKKYKSTTGALESRYLSTCIRPSVRSSIHLSTYLSARRVMVAGKSHSCYISSRHTHFHAFPTDINCRQLLYYAKIT